MSLFAEPTLSPDDLRVIEEIDALRRQLRHSLGQPRRWKGQLRRNLKARAVRGSNSIEGYDVSLDDAVALMDDDEALDADHRTTLEIVGYRNAMTYIQELAGDPHFSFDESLLRSLHFMMLGHDLSKSPGRYRQNASYVHDEEQDTIVYEGPDPDLVRKLMAELTRSLNKETGSPVFVRAAMAHLNLVMIHPFRDGNGRMARALQTLVLAREKIVAPEFSSIEEWLGRNTTAYYDVLADVGNGTWSPGRDTDTWVKFNLVAHHMQAQTVLRRVDEAGTMYLHLDALAAGLKLPERVTFALYPALVGLTVRRSAYERDAELESGTAARDLRNLVSAGLLKAIGATKGRLYVATEELRAIRHEIALGRVRPRNPYRTGDDEPASMRRTVTTME
ncbi:Fic family protein [Amycolatopsis sp. H20-H5]|uniref:Fic family protein n=1 Tax=Amycolatopsis sp. H20-H5 TaxID=3046309 RepID=UPI002DBA517B|nr:Fic family protein [Amycolatopsis sp. H20-H5]MEC3976309.1 Fic family protein [Amycolatopsis sp. H20-H5]